MTKEITVADLKEHLEERLDEVRNGVTLRVVEGDSAIVEISPAEEWIEQDGLRFRPGKGTLHDFVPPPPLEPEIDIVQYLLEERGDR